jgi:NAD(P)-dependent dehydrogenase (short-subunit alcohol dehydrogenase family)
MDFATRTTRPSTLLPFRLLGSIWRQAALTPTCPETPRLDGKLAVVTGGNAGVGVEIARGLAKRGAELIIAARTASTAEAARAGIARETGATVKTIALDLADLEDVRRAVGRIRDAAGDRGVDVLVANAGLWPTEHTKSPQGHEIAFATNTLGHHALIRGMLDDKLLRAGARVVILTGDIYIRASECTSDYAYEGKSGGALAYCRSKLGNLWFVRELQNRHPELEVVAVHPGVIDSGLGGKAEGLGKKMRPLVMIDTVAGAQAPLFCATQPGLERGAYYHNTMGKVRLPAGDPAADADKAHALWNRLEELSGPRD